MNTELNPQVAFPVYPSSPASFVFTALFDIIRLVLPIHVEHLMTYLFVGLASG